MKFLFSVLGIVCVIFVICIIGSIVLEEFPTLQPMWEEFKQVVSTIYNQASVKYGTAATILLIFGIGIALSTSKKG